jgi:sulfate transport system substrate-binding protein
MTTTRLRLLGCATPLLLAAAIAGCGDGTNTPPPTASPSAADDVSVTVVAPSTAQPLYDALIEAFRHTKDGRGTRVHATYGPSVDESLAVSRSDRVDVVSLTDEPAMRRLVDVGVVPPDWDEGPSHGVTATSTIALVVRRGNPHDIRGWKDLVRDDLHIVLPDPRTSGIGVWAILAAYGQAEARDGQRKAGNRYVTDLLRHVVDQPTTELRAIDDFTSGRGDVLLVARATAAAAIRDGARIQIVDPDPTIRVDYLSSSTIDASAQGLAFAAFLRSPQARRIARRFGYGHDLDAGKGVFTIAALGDWPRVERRLLDPGDLIPELLSEDPGARAHGVD